MMVYIVIFLFFFVVERRGKLVTSVVVSGQTRVHWFLAERITCGGSPTLSKIA